MAKNKIPIYMCGCGRCKTRLEGVFYCEVCDSRRFANETQAVREAMRNPSRPAPQRPTIIDRMATAASNSGWS